MKNIKNRHSGGTETFTGGQTYRNGDDSCADEALIARCLAGNMVAFGQLVERYQDRLFNMVLRMVGNYDDALEITQEALYRALKGLKKFQGKSAFFTWLYRIGINLCLNHRSKRQREHVTSLYSSSEFEHQAEHLAMLAGTAEDSPPRQVQIKEECCRALAALEKLDSPARAVVVLRDIEQLNYAQIALVLKVPVGTVKSRLSRARTTLREMLTEQE